jgi:predicted nucleic acid-binding protein
MPSSTVLNESVLVLDACALLAFFYGENGADIVEDKLNAAERQELTLYLHRVNFFEVYYKVMQKDSVKAQLVYDTILKLPITILSEISDDVFKEAARLKVRYKISLADSMALAAASIMQASILTCDHHEFDPVEQAEHIKFVWIR